MVINKPDSEFSQDDHQLVEFHNQIHPRIQIYPKYFELGFSPFPCILGRYAVLDRLLKALEFLAPQYGFLIWDVYRPRAVQAKLFAWMSEEIRKKFPLLTEQENYDETLKYVALPAQIGDNYCSPHLSGGAIDLTLFEIASGNELEMGTPFDDCTERAHSDYFDRQTQLSPEEEAIRERRQALNSAMQQVGFTVYPYEWWHFDLGNLSWSRITQRPAVFGPLLGDEEWPKSMAGKQIPV